MMQTRCQTGVHVPRLLGHGQLHEGLHAFIAMSAGASPLNPDMLKSCPAIAEHAMCAFKTIHQQNMLHGDIALQNFVASDTAQSMWLVDFVEVSLGSEDVSHKCSFKNECLWDCRTHIYVSHAHTIKLPYDIHTHVMGVVQWQLHQIMLINVSSYIHAAATHVSAPYGMRATDRK